MRTLTVLLIAGATWLALAAPAAAQRRFRLGPTGSTIALEDAAGNSHGFRSFGAAAALITGDEGETGLAFTRYNDLSTDGRARRLSLYAVDSYYYPVGTRGVAPFASTQLGLARVTESASVCPLVCQDTASATSRLALAFGLGVRINVAGRAAALVEGRFLQVPGSDIQALEARATVSAAFGGARRGEFLAGTLGPAVSAFIPVSGPLRARMPFAGVRFRRDTRNAGSAGLEIAFAPLEVTGGCTPPGCEPNAILFAPGYEAGAHATWGRAYGVVGLLLAGIYTQGPDRGIAQGLHGGFGLDAYSGRVLWNVNSRLLWLRRTSGENVLGVQIGVSLSPRLRG